MPTLSRTKAEIVTTIEFDTGDMWQLMTWAARMYSEGSQPWARAAPENHDYTLKIVDRTDENRVGWNGIVTVKEDV